MVPLEAIVPAAQNNINTQFILLEKGKTTWDGQNRMCLALVADKTSTVHLQLWGEECEAFESGDIIRMENGIFFLQQEQFGVESRQERENRESGGVHHGICGDT
ncbi:hypothetical protein GQ457_17G005110 [Hibiscus cannabinus]